MARIRSVHPSLFTDEAWVSCSPLARVLYVGLMTDADDQGLFEWKPLQIKMRLLPADHTDVPELLADLVRANLIAPLEVDGKKLGAIRYFRRFQRPKKPNAVFPLPPTWAAYVGLTSTGSDTDGEPVPNRFPTGGEKSPQMEDGGGRKEEKVLADGSAAPDLFESPKAKRSPAKTAAPSPLNDTVAAIWAAAPKVSRTRSSRALVTAALNVAVRAGEDRAAILAGFRAWSASEDVTRDGGQYAMGAHRVVKDGFWQEFAAGATPTVALADLTDADWQKRLDVFAEAGAWSDDQWGPCPGSPGCLAPPRLLIGVAA